MKTLLLADIQCLDFETNRAKRRIDFVEFMRMLKSAEGFHVDHAVAYLQPRTEEFERVLAGCGFELVIDKNCHTHRLCMDSVTLGDNFDHIVFLSTRYYLQPVVTHLKRLGKKVSIFGFNTPPHIKSLTDYYDIDVFQQVSDEVPNPAE